MYTPRSLADSTAVRVLPINEIVKLTLETNICIVYRGQQRTYFVFTRGRILPGQKFSSVIYVTFLAQI